MWTEVVVDWPGESEQIMSKKLACLVLFMFVFPAIAFPTRAGSQKSGFDRRPLLLRAMAQEMDRSMKKLAMKGFELPYFIAYEMKESESRHIQARYGAIYKSSHDRLRRLRVEVRVG